MAEKTVQISVTIKTAIAERLAEIASKGGRSRSNLCAWLLEQALRKGDYDN